MSKSRAERVLSRRLLILGLLLTLVAVALDYLGVLRPLEAWFYDRRVRNFQFSAPPPTDRLVHLDIDDETLEVIGRWPWRRVIIAQIIDELRQVGARVVSLDVLFSEPEDPSPHPTELDRPPVDHDQELARALAGGRAVLPVAFHFGRTQLPQAHYQAVVDEFGGHLELRIDELNQKLKQRHLEPASEDEFDAAMQEWSTRLLAPLITDDNVSFDDVCRKLLPNLYGSYAGSPQVRALGREYNKFMAARSMRRLFRLVPEGLPPLLGPSRQTLPIPRISRSASDAGFVNSVMDRDAVIRSIPLFADFNGQLVPQFGLAIACAYLGVKPEDLKVSADRVVIPRPGGGGDVVIPMHSERSAKYGERGMFFDVPFVGGDDWLRMYDFPRHEAIKQHINVLQVFYAADAERRLRANNRRLDEAILLLLSQSDEKKTREYKAHLPAPDDTAARAAHVKDALEELTAQQIGVLSESEARALGEREYSAWEAVRFLRRYAELAEQNSEFARILKDRRAELREIFQDRAVLIEWSAQGAQDIVSTSMHTTCPGGIVHGSIFNAILTNYFWTRLPAWVTIACTLVVGLLSTMTASQLRPLAAAAATPLVGGAFVAVNILLFGYQRRILGFAGPMTAWLLVWSAIPIARYFFEAGVRARIQKRFSTYVDPALVNYLLEHPEKLHLDGELREMTVVFTDLVGFTSLAEEMREAAVKLLGEYMALMVPLIRAHHGFVSKFIGDGLMFFYGAPESNPHHAADAVETVIQMQRAMKDFAESVKRRGLKELSMRAGVNSATMIVGDAGMETAADYTPLGDGMNLGSRLEGANKAFGTRVLISARTVFLCDGKYLVRRIANIVVKGKREAVMAHEPLGLTEKATDEQRRLVDMTNAMVDAYVAGDFKKCIDAAAKLEEGFSDQKTLVAKYRELCEHYLAHPPEQFNGTILLSEK
jgi:class 3 adenylate cyclase/CHASE2 domain-containing sensor protein